MAGVVKKYIFDIRFFNGGEFQQEFMHRFSPEFRF
jgi:hypothetical protein